MSPRSSAEVAALTRRRIVRAAVDRSSRYGLEGVSVRDLAGDLGMSKAGVIAPFGSQAGLMGAALDDAVETFRAVVIAPALARPRPERLDAIIVAWVAYLTDCPFPGGCFLTTVSVEQDNRDGELRERTATFVAQWLAFLARAARLARPDLTPRRARDLATTLYGIAMSANQEIQLLGDRSAGARARRAMRTVAAAF